MDLDHKSTCVSANQKKQFAQAVSIEVTIAWHGLLENLLCDSRGISTYGVRGTRGSSPVSSVNSSTLCDNIASQVQIVLQVVTSLTTTSRSETVTDLRHLPVNEPCCPQMASKAETFCLYGSSTGCVGRSGATEEGDRKNQNVIAFFIFTRTKAQLD